MKPRKIKLFWTWGTVLLLLLAVAVTLTIQWPRLFPYHHTSDLYRHYAAQPGIDATFLKNFPVNDTLCLDVLLLEATDSAGWERLKRDFHIVDPSPEALEMIARSNCSVGVRLTPKNDVGGPYDTINPDNNYVIAVDNINHAVGIFYTRNEKEIDEVMHFNYNKTNLQIYKDEKSN